MDDSDDVGDDPSREAGRRVESGEPRISVLVIRAYLADQMS